MNHTLHKLAHLTVSLVDIGLHMHHTVMFDSGLVRKMMYLAFNGRLTSEEIEGIVVSLDHMQEYHLSTLHEGMHGLVDGKLNLREFMHLLGDIRSHQSNVLTALFSVDSEPAVTQDFGFADTERPYVEYLDDEFLQELGEKITKGIKASNIPTAIVVSEPWKAAAYVLNDHEDRVVLGMIERIKGGDWAEKWLQKHLINTGRFKATGPKDVFIIEEVQPAS